MTLYRYRLTEALTGAGGQTNNPAQCQETEKEIEHRRQEERRYALDVLQNTPLGFSTNHAKVDLAAKVLRLMYINDLRDLQTMINETIVLMQEHTADPKTEAHLGRVGSTKNHKY